MDIVNPASAQLSGDASFYLEAENNPSREAADHLHVADCDLGLLECILDSRHLGTILLTATSVLDYGVPIDVSARGEILAKLLAAMHE